MTSRISTRTYQAGFLFVVALMAAVGGFSFWSERRTQKRVDSLVERALEREAVIANIRVAALQLEEAVNDHINAADDAEREAADEEMARILEDIKQSSNRYTQDLPAGELEAWKRFNETSQLLAKQVRTAVKYSNRKEAERARKHLEEEIKPITWDLDALASELTVKNAAETKKLLHALDQLRRRTTFLGGGVAALAVLLALVVGWQLNAILARQERTISDQVAELGRRNQELDAFASRVAHDLMSPLAPLKGYLTLVRRSPALTDPAVREMLAAAESSASRMAELIEALLRFCRAGRPSEPTVADLSTAVSTLLTEVSQTASREGVKLERQIDHRLPVACPSQLLQSIAQNVLSNAVKYSAGRPDARVTVRAMRERGQAVFEVTDNGRGMSEETQRSLFQPFFRAPETRGLPGHGLGLATTKRLVEAHGGTLVVRSALNAGSQVTIRFPIAPAKDDVPARPSAPSGPPPATTREATAAPPPPPPVRTPAAAEPAASTPPVVALETGSPHPTHPPGAPPPSPRQAAPDADASNSTSNSTSTSTSGVAEPIRATAPAAGG